MFSLEELMKANPLSVKQEEEQAPDQLWNMQAATPLFGTAHDQALLTTPLKKEPSPSMDSMTMPSRTPLARRWLPLGLAIGGACLGVAAAGWWFTGPSQAEPAPQAAIVGTPTVASAAVAPASPVSVATSAPSSEDQLAADPPTVAPPSPTGAPQPGAAPTEAATPPGEAVASAPGSSAVGGDKPKSSKKPAAKPAPSSARKPAAAFDKGAAKAALSAAAAKAAGCGAGGAPGKGKVMLTFAPSGKVSSASLVEGPFAGKSAGACALKHFRAASVPAFAGSAVTVSKSFSVQ